MHVASTMPATIARMCSTHARCKIQANALARMGTLQRGKVLYHARATTPVPPLGGGDTLYLPHKKM